MKLWGDLVGIFNIFGVFLISLSMRNIQILNSTFLFFNKKNAHQVHGSSFSQKAVGSSLFMAYTVYLTTLFSVECT